MTTPTPMLQKYPTPISIDKLVPLCAMLPKTTDEGQVWMAFNQCTPVSIAPKLVQDAVFDLAERVKGLAMYIMVNVLNPRQESPWHSDKLPSPPVGRVERYHLAVSTNKMCFWEDKVNGLVHIPEGCWMGPLPYYNEHRVLNQGDTVRTHIIADLLVTSGSRPL